MDNFLRTLLQILKEKSSLIKTQKIYLHQILTRRWDTTKFNQPDIRDLPFNKKRIISDMQYRIETLTTLKNAMNDGYFLIKAFVDGIFGNYLNSKQFKKDFLEGDRKPAAFLIGETLVGSLLQFIMLDKSEIPMEYLIIAKNKEMMKINPLTISKIIQRVEKLGFSVNEDYLLEFFDSLIDLNYVREEKIEKTNEKRYKFIKDFTLSKEGNLIFQRKINSLLEWIISLWRSLYNIRSINTPIPENYPLRAFLVETVKRAATQGFSNAYNVIENIGEYYKLLEERNLK